MEIDPTGWQIAVDTGGTFTDAFAVAPDGRRQRTKLLSSSRLRAGVDAAGEGGVALRLDRDFGAPRGLLVGFSAQVSGGHTDEVSKVISWDPEERALQIDRPLEVSPGEAIDLFTGEEVPVLAARMLTATRLGDRLPSCALRLATTRMTNALLENRGTPPVLVLPEGLGDLLEIGDQRREDLFALTHRKTRLPVARVYEIAGHLDPDGGEVEPLDLSPTLERIAAEVPEGERQTAAVALLNSYRDDRHEAEVAAALSGIGFQDVVVSSGLSQSMRILPRAQTAVAAAYLAPSTNKFFGSVAAQIGGEFLAMTSSGGLRPATEFYPTDGLLSGPAGGLIGALAAARAASLGDFITFDMGGTSTDVARVGNSLPLRFEHAVGAASVQAPALHIETIAAGGGSICRVGPEGVDVGPASAGAEPGPACYGRGGAFTLTDVNLLLGRIDPGRARVPLDAAASEAAFATFREELAAAGQPGGGRRELLEGLLGVAVGRMAEAIRKISVREGYDPRKHALLAFGGAGPQHACSVADALGIETILVPGDAGLLSARGVASAQLQRFVSRSVLRDLPGAIGGLEGQLAALEAQALAAVGAGAAVSRRIAELRLAGQEATLEIEVGAAEALPAQFAGRFENLFGYPPPPDREVELVSLRVAAATAPDEWPATEFGEAVPVEDLTVESDPFSTLAVEPGWAVRHAADGSRLLERLKPDGRSRIAAGGHLASDITRHRLAGIVGEMGALLKRCAISTNIREREDFSCAILDAAGTLAINAPHIPVHLGALGLCVREVAAEIDIGPGDVVVTNHPAFGGSHLPDITVIAAAFSADGRRTAYLANRAHHAEIGGSAPGSMPPSARCLADEGVAIPPTYLIRKGQPRFETIAATLGTGRYPSRAIDDNIADLQAQAAALRSAVAAVEALGHDPVREAISLLLRRSDRAARECISALPPGRRRAVEHLDGGAPIAVGLERRGGHLEIDFTGTGAVLTDNLNATPAIVRSAVLYVLRLMLDEELPLNEGLLAPVALHLPRCLLNPDFGAPPEHCPPVVGGNVETSQRLVDTLIKALEIQACSQGTMNNLLFGNRQFGYYETVAGGAGAGPAGHGGHALHTHMTNTAITDPEVLEWRYPVRVRRFAIRRGSGGGGRFRGGDGVVRELEFSEPLTVSLLAEHRAVAPYGLAGGGDGEPGRHTLIAPDGTATPLPGRFSGEVAPGSRLRVETPGGGGYGR